MLEKVCALCYGTYANLKQHLKKKHFIPNRKEYLLLVRYGNARISETLDCPICSKQAFVRLDKHLQDAHSLKTVEDREPIITEAKRLAITKEFAELRRSDPDPPMVSTLGLSSDLENDRPPSASEDDCRPNPRSSTPIKSSDSANTGSRSSQALFESLPTSSGPLPDSSSSGPPPTSSCSLGTVGPSPAPGGSLETQPRPSDNNSSLACPCKCLNLVKRVEALERKLEGRVLEVSVQPAPGYAQSAERTTSVPRTPVAARRGQRSSNVQRTPRSVQKGEHLRKVVKDTLYKKVIDDFEKFRVGPRSSRKDKDNARQAAGHCLRFCQYMVGGLSEASTTLDLRFLARMDKLRNYPVYLKNKGYMPTTVRNMLINITMFYKHIQHWFLRSSRLKEADVGRILYEMKRIQSDIRREVVVRRQQVKRNKTANQLDSAQELAFLTAAKKRIPQLLRLLYSDGTMGNEHCKLMGYVMGYLCIISGHRSIVLTNMLTRHVREADCWADGQRYQILVDDHKTVKSFGQASLVLSATEYSWVAQLAERKCCTVQQPLRNVFHTILGGEIVKPLNFLHLAWVDAGCQGKVSFNMIRSSVATQADKHLTESERRKVARAMCHDPDTAERFYVALPERDLAFETRQLRMKALRMERKKAKASPKLPAKEPFSSPSDTTSEDEVVVYDDEPDSSTSVSSEELRAMRKRRGLTKRKLHFSPAARQPRKLARSDIITPSKIQVTIERLKTSLSQYYLDKMRATHSAPQDAREEAVSPEEQACPSDAELASTDISSLKEETALDTPSGRPPAVLEQQMRPSDAEASSSDMPCLEKEPAPHPPSRQPPTLEKQTCPSDAEATSTSLDHLEGKPWSKATEELQGTYDSEPLWGTQAVKDSLDTQDERVVIETTDVQEIILQFEAPVDLVSGGHGV